MYTFVVMCLEKRLEYASTVLSQGNKGSHEFERNPGVFLGTLGSAPTKIRFSPPSGLFFATCWTIGVLNRGFLHVHQLFHLTHAGHTRPAAGAASAQRQQAQQRRTHAERAAVAQRGGLVEGRGHLERTSPPAGLLIGSEAEGEPLLHHRRPVHVTDAHVHRAAPAASSSAAPAAARAAAALLHPPLEVDGPEVQPRVDTARALDRAAGVCVRRGVVAGRRRPGELQAVPVEEVEDGGAREAREAAQAARVREA